MQQSIFVRIFCTLKGFDIRAVGIPTDFSKPESSWFTVKSFPQSATPEELEGFAEALTNLAASKATLSNGQTIFTPQAAEMIWAQLDQKAAELGFTGTTTFREAATDPTSAQMLAYTGCFLAVPHKWWLPSTEVSGNVQWVILCGPFV